MGTCFLNRASSRNRPHPSSATSWMKGSMVKMELMEYAAETGDLRCLWRFVSVAAKKLTVMLGTYHEWYQLDYSAYSN